MKRILLLLLTLCIAINSKALKVVVKPFPPNVIINQNGKPHGFDIEAWEYIAQDLSLDFDYHVVDEFKLILPGIEDTLYDIGIAGITIRSDREERIDFSHAYMSSGLSIITLKTDHGFIPTAWRMILRIWRPFLVLAIYLFLCSILIYWAEYGNKSFDDKFKKGMGQAVYFTNTVTSSTGFGDFVPKTPIGRTIACCMMWIGIGIIFPYMTAVMNDVLNYEDPQTNKEWLKGKRIATVESSSSENTLYEMGIKTSLYKNIKECQTALDDNTVDGIVFDMPVVRWCAKQQSEK